MYPPQPNKHDGKTGVYPPLSFQFAPYIRHEVLGPRGKAANMALTPIRSRMWPRCFVWTTTAVLLVLWGKPAHLCSCVYIYIYGYIIIPGLARTHGYAAGESRAGASMFVTTFLDCSVPSQGHLRTNKHCFKSHIHKSFYIRAKHTSPNHQEIAGSQLKTQGGQ